MKTLPLKLLLPLLVLLLAGCENPFRPPLHDISAPVINNRTPEELLQNLERAYREKNIDIYKSLLHPDFRFEVLASEVSQIGIDMNGDNIRDAWWGYELEVAYTDRMFNYGSSDGLFPPPDEINLVLQIPPQENWENDPELGHEEWIVIPCTFNLLLRYTASNSAFNASGRAVFYLRPVEDRWYIAIWRDESYL